MISVFRCDLTLQQFAKFNCRVLIWFRQNLISATRLKLLEIVGRRKFEPNITGIADDRSEKEKKKNYKRTSNHTAPATVMKPRKCQA